MTRDPGATPAVDATRCPLCGEGNACGVAAGAGTCWCFSTEVDRDALQRVPEAAGRQACLCQRCAARQGSPAPADA